MRKHREDHSPAPAAQLSAVFHAKAQRRGGRRGEEKVVVCWIIVILSRFILFNENLANNSPFPLPFASSAPPRLRVRKWGIVFFLLFLSCTTTPKIPELTPLESGIMPLDEGASAYILIDVANARPILEGISYIPTTDKNVKQMLDRTRSAAVAVFLPSSEETRRFQLVSWGSYPASGSSIAFGTSKDWKKQRSAFLNSVYWHSDKAQLSVAVKSSRAYVLAAMTKAPHDPIPSPEGIRIPEGFSEFGRGAVLSCWLSDPGPVLNQKLKETGIPLEIPAEQLFVRLFPEDGEVSTSQPVSASQPKYEAHIKITVPNAAQARAVAAFITIARAFMPPPVSQQSESQDSAAQNRAAMLSAMLFANPVVQEDNTLLIKTSSLSVNEIALLFSIFSL